MERLLGDHVKTVMQVGVPIPHETFGDRAVTTFSWTEAPSEWIGGNPLETIQAYPEKKFDFIFINNGPVYDYDSSLGLLHICRRLAHKDTIVVMNKVVSNGENFTLLNDGPVRAWGDIREDRLLKQVLSEDYGVGEGISVGQYVV